MPPQHGAWAFLGLPLVVALTVSPWTPVLILLAAAWISAYPMSYFILALVREYTARRPDPRRFRRPLVLWLAICTPTALALVTLRPWLVWVGIGYAVTFAVNIAFARRRDDRALLNDAVFILQCTAMVPVTWAVAVGARSWWPPSLATAPMHLWVLTVSVALILAGSTLQVKSLIRERANPRFAARARGFAVASLIGSVGLAAWWGLPSGLLLVLPFAYFAARAFVRPAGMAPVRIGMTELVGFVLLPIAALVASR